MPVDIAKLRELLEAATPRPWDSKGCGFGDGKRTVGFTNGFQDDAVQTFATGAHNAALICAAVNALPELLAVYEAAFAYRDSRCSGEEWCDRGEHESRCAIRKADDALMVAVDAARKEQP